MPTEAELRRLAREHAPLVRLHPDEDYLPMSPEDFIRGSRLELVQKLSSGYHRTAVFDHAARAWDTQPGALEHFGVPVALLESWSQLHVDPPDTGWSRRPHDERLAPDGHLFALQHRSREPTVAFDPAAPPPAYYFVETPDEHDVWISYWLFFGYSHFLFKWAHQGDWEHLRLRLRDGRVTEALFAIHEDLYRVRRDLLTFERGRPVAYSARSRHATWWKTGSHLPLPLFNERTTWEEVLSDRERALLEDETADGGALWDTGRDLRPLAEQPWRRYAGAWGKLGDGASTTGPLGPWYKRFIPPDREIVEEG